MKINNLLVYTRKALILSAIFFLIGLVSCKKDGELQPDFDDGGLSISFVDTFSVATKVIQEDSLRTDLSVKNLVGLYNDPLFGPMSSSIYSQVTLTGVNVDLGSPTSTLDSIVLTLEYDELFGDTAYAMTLNVYELTTEMSSSTDYYSNTYVSYNPTPIGTLTFVPNLTDSVDIVFDTIRRAPHVRITLSNTFGQSLMNADSQGSDEMKDNATFTAFMNGLYITTADSVGNTSLSSGQGSILSFDMNSSLSTVTMYYNDTSSYDFTINTSGVKYSRFDHDYTGTDIEAHLTNSPLRDTTLIYTSTLAGVKTKIDIQNIKNIINDGPVTINKAELIITLESGTEGSFDDPLESLSLVGIDENGDDFFLPDFFEGLDYYGGSYDSDTKTYSFNIARHINDLIYNTGNYGMYLVANGSSVSAKRSVLASEHDPVAKIKLNITYSKL
jgi:hypothetical protein